MWILKILRCRVCSDETVHCQTLSNSMRCEICGDDKEYFVSLNGMKVLRYEDFE